MEYRGPAVEERVEALLRGAGARFSVVAHEAGHSALALAALRGTDPRIGGKAILMKLDCVAYAPFAILAIPGDGRLDGRQIRSGLGAKRYRFATDAELAAHTGLRPGEIPPFGRPIFDLPLIVDEALARNDAIAFTAGRRDRSFLLSTADWLAVARPACISRLTQ